NIAARMRAADNSNGYGVLESPRHQSRAIISVVSGRGPGTIPSWERGRVEMRRTRLSDVTAVTDVSDGGDLEGMSFLPPAPATRLPGAAAVTSAPALPGAVLLPGIGPMPVVAPALPTAAAASVHSVESPAQNAAPVAVGPAGATADQVRQALNATNLSVTGAGSTVGVLSDSFNALGGAAAGYGRALPPAARRGCRCGRPSPPARMRGAR